MEFYESDRPSKRFVAINSRGQRIYFGQPGAHTYIDGADEKTRDNYRKRHGANKAERHLIENLIVSPALLSWYVIWGESQDIRKNIKALLRLKLS